VTSLEFSFQVIAAAGSRLAAWSLGIKQDAWRVHSTLVLPEYCKVTVLDNDAGIFESRQFCHFF
jgi:hypothetical protein